LIDSMITGILAASEGPDQAFGGEMVGGGRI
jgi:hypothetical protein